jgi:hypothetical protein
VKYTLHEPPGLYLAALSAMAHGPSLVLLLTITLLGKAACDSGALKATDRGPLGWKEDKSMDRPWFDQETDVLLIDEYIVEMDSYRRIVEDGEITDAELVEQTERVASILRRLEEALSPPWPRPWPRRRSASWRS